MRTVFVATLLAAVAALAPAADPPPLVKPVAPTGTAVRVRVPIVEDKNTFAQFPATIPKPKGKKGETVAVKVLIDTLPNHGIVGLKTWQDWGFEVPANRIGVLPELIISGAQVAPKPMKGRDVELRLTNVKVTITEPPAGQEAVFGGCDLWLSLRHLSASADATSEPRFYFADRFLELTAPGATVKKLNAGDATSPDPRATAGELVPVAGPLKLNALSFPVFAFSSVNGRTEYTSTTGKLEKVNVRVSSVTNYPEPGILMTLGTARGCGVELEREPKVGETVSGKVKELRLGFATGDGFKAQKDFVLKDVTVQVTDNKSESAVWLGPRFVEAYLTDAVYGCGSDGAWRLHGRVKADLLEDIKTRMPPPKKP